MKIIRVEPQEGFEKGYTLQLEFNKETGHLVGTAGTATAKGDLIVDIDVDLNKWVGKVVEARVVMSELGYEVLVYDSLKNYSIANGMPGASEVRSHTKQRLFRIFVHENLDESTLQIFKGHEAIPGFEDIVEDGDPQLRMYNFVRRDPELEHAMKLYRLKSAMLGEVDQRDSMSYLEAQVDILTRVILAVLPDNKDVLVELLRKADARSVLNIKDRASLEKEFVVKKDWVRKVQKDYYEAKKTLEASAS